MSIADTNYTLQHSYNMFTSNLYNLANKNWLAVQSAIISKHKLNLKSAYFTQYITSSVKQEFIYMCISVLSIVQEYNYSCEINISQLYSCNTTILTIINTRCINHA